MVFQLWESFHLNEIDPSLDEMSRSALAKTVKCNIWFREDVEFRDFRVADWLRAAQASGFADC